MSLGSAADWGVGVLLSLLTTTTTSTHNGDILRPGSVASTVCWSITKMVLSFPKTASGQSARQAKSGDVGSDRQLAK